MASGGLGGHHGESVESRDAMLDRILNTDPSMVISALPSTVTPVTIYPKVLINIYAGYTFRRMVEMFAENIKEGTICCSRNKIKITEMDKKTMALIIRAKIDTYKLTDYEFASPNEEVQIGINFEDLKAYCSAAGRKQSVTLDYSRGEAKLVVYGKDERYEYHPTVTPIEHVEYNLSAMYTRGERNPNVTCLGVQFSQALVHMNKIRGNVIVYCYEDGIEICPPDSSCAVSAIGKCTVPILLEGVVVPPSRPSKEEQRCQLRSITRKLVIPKLLVKTLGKIKHICGNGTVRIYVEGRSPLRISTELDKFGTIDVFVRDNASL